MSLTVEKTANAAAVVSIPSWLVSLVVEALPFVQFCAGVLAFVASGFAIFVKWHEYKKLRGVK